MFVDHDAAINTAIRKIRRALDDDAEHPRFVETVVGKGYRFIAPLETHDANVRLNASRVDGAERLLTVCAIACRTTSSREENNSSFWTQGRTCLGRDPEATVYIDHPSVSRRHARISIHSATGSPRGSREPERNVSRRTAHRDAD